MPPVEESRRSAYRRPGFGEWHPAAHGAALGVVQLVAAAQAGLRGLDYLQNRDAIGASSSPAVRAVEEIGDLRIWGALFLFGAMVQIVSLSGGWIIGIFTGHAILFGVYMVLGFILLGGIPQFDLWVSMFGAALLFAGLYLALVRWEKRGMLRFALSIVFVVAGGWIATCGLGVDFRSATGVLAAGLVQIALMMGMAVYVYGARESATR